MEGCLPGLPKMLRGLSTSLTEKHTADTLAEMRLHAVCIADALLNPFRLYTENTSAKKESTPAKKEDIFYRHIAIP